MCLDSCYTEISIDRFFLDRYKGAEYKGSYRVPFRKKEGNNGVSHRLYDGQWRPPVPRGSRTFFLAGLCLHGLVGIDGEVRGEWAGGCAQWRAYRQRRRGVRGKGATESPIGSGRMNYVSTQSYWARNRHVCDGLAARQQCGDGGSHGGARC